MPSDRRLHFALKTILFWAIFLLLHYLYEWLPVFPINLVSGTSEAFFQHQKVALYAYLTVTLGEWWITQRRFGTLNPIPYGRLLACVIVPWVIFVVWFLPAGLYGRLPSITLEVIYANLAVLITGWAVVSLDHSLEGTEFSKTARWVIAGLFLASIVLFVALSQRLPWADVFREPDWRP